MQCVGFWIFAIKDIIGTIRKMWIMDCCISVLGLLERKEGIKEKKRERLKTTESILSQ